MDPDLYDAIVVGAGPGGATAAFFLGEAGKKVLVLEKETLPRYKACGGGLSTGLLEQFPFSFEPVIESRVRAITYTLGKRSVTVPLPDRPMRTVMRDDFDAHILAHARAEVRQGCAVKSVRELDDRVVVETREGAVFQALALVAADGANSVVARALGLRRKKNLVGAIEVEAAVSPEVMERFADRPVFIFGEIDRGYLWIFPKSRHLSVGIGAFHPKPGELQSTLKRVMGEFGIQVEGQPTHGHPIPIYTRREKIATARALLVGDAAGLVDPLSGEGIQYAIKSGRLAAQAILSGQIEAYPDRVYREIGSSHRFGVGLALFYYQFPRLCFWLGVRNPLSTRAFVDLLSDRADYPEVILRIIGTLPLFLLSETIAALAGLAGGPARKQAVRAAVYGIPPETEKD